MGITAGGLVAIVVIVLFSGVLWELLHELHVHAWWLFPLLLLGVGQFEADEANIGYVFGFVALISSRIVAGLTAEYY